MYAEILCGLSIRAHTSMFYAVSIPFRNSKCELKIRTLKSFNFPKRIIWAELLKIMLQYLGRNVDRHTG